MAERIVIADLLEIIAIEPSRRHVSVVIHPEGVRPPLGMCCEAQSWPAAALLEHPSFSRLCEADQELVRRVAAGDPDLAATEQGPLPQVSP